MSERTRAMAFDHLSEGDRDLLAYYHLSSCAWVADGRRACSCDLLRRVDAIVSAAKRAVWS